MSPSVEPLRVGFVPGVTPDKWARRWRELGSHGRLETVPLAEDADPVAPLHEGTLDLSLVRLPVDTGGLHVVRLYDEVPVVVVSTEHPVAAYDTVDVSDLVDEHLFQGGDAAPMTTRQAVESVAAEAGVLIVPMSVARLHHRRDVVAVPVTGVAASTVALVWPVAADDERRQAFVGVVKGRTRNSSRR